ncbi:MAG: DUF883 family protein [Klebsiella pneumoniae]|nr:DUF883 family protein [Klebsiella pneumoniae]
MKHRIALLLVLTSLSASALAASPCQEKEQDIQREISYAEKHHNQSRIDGLNTALRQVRENCSDSKLKADHQQKIAKQREETRTTLQENDMAKENVTDDLRAELKTLADTLEEVLNSSADKSKEEMGKLRSKAESALKESRARLGETSEAILRQTRETAARADDYVRENPWTGVGIGAAVGLVLGVLLSRR